MLNFSAVRDAELVCSAYNTRKIKAQHLGLQHDCSFVQASSDESSGLGCGMGGSNRYRQRRFGTGVVPSTTRSENDYGSSLFHNAKAEGPKNCLLVTQGQVLWYDASILCSVVNE